MSSLQLASHVSDSLGRVRSGLRERCPQLGEGEGTLQVGFLAFFLFQLVYLRAGNKWSLLGPWNALHYSIGLLVGFTISLSFFFTLVNLLIVFTRTALAGGRCWASGAHFGAVPPTK